MSAGEEEERKQQESSANGDPSSVTTPEKWKLKIKTPSQEKEMEILENSDVKTLRDEVARVFEQTPERLCLVYGGKIMKDEDNIKSYGVKDKHSIHLVIRALQRQQQPPGSSPGSQTPPVTNVGGVPGHAPSPRPPGIPGLPSGVQLDQLMDNPLVQSMVNNPEMLRNVVSNNPQIQSLMERHPELSHALNNPDVMRQAMQVMRNPAMMQEMMRNYDRALSNLESLPGGFNALQRFYNDYQEPMYSAMSNQNPFAALGGNAPAETPEAPRGENSEPLPNPWGGAPVQRPGATSTRVQPTGGGNPFAALSGTGGAAGAGGMDSLMNQLSANPQLMERALQAMNSPDYMRVISDPRGIQALNQLNQAYRTLNELAPNMFPNMGMGGVPGGFGAPDVPQTTPQLPPNLDPSNNPQMNQMMEQMLGMMRGQPGGAAGGMTTPQAPEERFREELLTLQQMGFMNRDANIRALTATFGDVNAAVERLLQAGSFPQ